jgi:hypothetical protein
MLVSRTGLEIRTLDDVWRFATCLAKSGLAPKGIESPEAITIAVQMGMEVGLPPMAALQNIAIVNGRPSLFGDAMLAVVRATGDLEEFTEWFEQDGKRIDRTPSEYKDGTTAVCHVKRRGYDAAPDVAFSVADAKRAGLWGKQGPWSQYPFRMLKFRARAFALRDGFGDALRGMLSTEEVQDMSPKEVSGRVVETAKPEPFGTQSPPPASENDEVLGGSSPGADVAEATPQPEAPKPARRTAKPKPKAEPEAPSEPDEIPFGLEGGPGTPAQELRRRVKESGVNVERFNERLAANMWPPLSAISGGEAAEALELVSQLITEATRV